MMNQTVDSRPMPQRVVVTDVDMSIGNMTAFMIKWAIAAIPATILLALIGGIAFALISAMIVL
jgi:hypothetical protein